VVDEQLRTPAVSFSAVYFAARRSRRQAWFNAGINVLNFFARVRRIAMGGQPIGRYVSAALPAIRSRALANRRAESSQDGS
jgi:hypothetical protein